MCHAKIIEYTMCGCVHKYIYFCHDCLLDLKRPVCQPVVAASPPTKTVTDYEFSPACCKTWKQSESLKLQAKLKDAEASLKILGPVYPGTGSGYIAIKDAVAAVQKELTQVNKEIDKVARTLARHDQFRHSVAEVATFPGQTRTQSRFKYESAFIFMKDREQEVAEVFRKILINIKTKPKTNASESAVAASSSTAASKATQEGRSPSPALDSNRNATRSQERRDSSASVDRHAPSAASVFDVDDMPKPSRSSSRDAGRQRGHERKASSRLARELTYDEEQGPPAAKSFGG